MPDVLQGLAITGLVLLGAGFTALVAFIWWLSLDDDAGVWTAAELAAIPRPAGRHRHVADRAADQLGSRTWTPRHDEDEVPPCIRSVTMELPVVQRARVLAWEHGITRRPAPTRDRRLRRVQLELARRLRQSGVPTVLRPTVGVA